jgi:uncharacterized protein (TIGR02246 family)
MLLDKCTCSVFASRVMSRISSAILSSALLFAALSPVERICAQEAAKPAAPDASKALKASVDEFVKAYNAHDPKRLAELFLAEALVYGEDAKLLEGRERIASAFAGVFEVSPEIRIEVAVNAIDMIGPTMAVETGMSTSLATPDAIPERSRYVALHVLRDSVWKIALLRDMPNEPSPQEHLMSLSWLVGDWIDESREGKVSTTCRWDDSRCFLLQEITVQRAGESAMKVSQRIGWDARAKTIKAWMFDSTGGYGESVWTPTDTGWLIKATAVRSNGSSASATNFVEIDGYDAYGWRSVDRVVGGDVEPDVEVRVVRRPPAPSTGE